MLFSAAFGFAAGIVCEAFVRPAPAAIGIAAGAGFLCAIRRPLWPVAALFVFFSIGIVRSEVARPNEARFAGDVGGTVTVEGVISSPVAFSERRAVFTLDAGDVSLRVGSDDGAKLAYGDKISVTGALELPENFMTDQGTEFDYISYLYKDGILYKLEASDVRTISSGHGNPVVAVLIPVKAAIVRSFRRALPAGDADLLAGLDLGEKGSISDEFRNDLVTTGTIHIIALSGYNVTIIANVLRDLFTDILKLSARLAAVSGSVCIVLFVTLTGLQSSAVRAGIMALIGIYARGEGRTYQAFRALVLAGVLMIVWDPKYLVYDVSFQLSFLATLGLMFLTPIFERAFVRLPKRLLYVIPLRELSATTLGAQTGVLPFILYKTGSLSIIALPANVLVLPAIPSAMGIGALAGLLGSFSSVLAYPVATAAHWLLAYITGTITFLAKVPYAAVTIRDFPLWLCIVMYILMIAWTWRALLNRMSAAKST